MIHILICDDDRDIVNALKIYLQDPEYRIFEAGPLLCASVLA